MTKGLLLVPKDLLNGVEREKTPSIYLFLKGEPVNFRDILYFIDVIGLLTIPKKKQGYHFPTSPCLPDELFSSTTIQ
jgi:hypothetical protein